MICLLLLQYLQIIEAFYLFHKYTNRFVGDTDGEWPAPVDRKDAINYKLGSSNTLSAFTIDRGNGKSFDIRGSYPRGRRLGYYRKHGKLNQQFRLVYTFDNSYLLVLDDKCIIWNPSKKQFLAKDCKEATEFGRFLIYQKTSDRHNDVESNEDSESEIGDPASDADNFEPEEETPTVKYYSRTQIRRVAPNKAPLQMATVTAVKPRLVQVGVEETVPVKTVTSVVRQPPAPKKKVILKKVVNDPAQSRKQVYVSRSTPTKKYRLLPNNEQQVEYGYRSGYEIGPNSNLTYWSSPSNATYNIHNHPGQTYYEDY